MEANRRLSEIFQIMADLLSLKAANPHRIRAYRRAAESLSQLTLSVRDLARRRELTSIPGIGRELSTKIEEFLATGTIQSYESLKAGPPAAVVDWATLPGLSPPVVHHLYYRLGIRTLEDLETLVQSHMLRTLPGVTVDEDLLLAAIRARLKHNPTDRRNG